MSVQVNFTRIDKGHVLVEVACVKRIVHDNKELKEVTAELIEKYAEEYVFGEQLKSSRAPMHEPGAVMQADPAAKEAKK